MYLYYEDFGLLSQLENVYGSVLQRQD